MISAIHSQGYVSVAIDGWEDHQKFPTLGFTVTVPGGPAFLFRFARMLTRETAAALEKEVSSVVQELKDMGLVVTAVIADNARNIQRGLSLASNFGLGFVVGRCLDILFSPLLPTMLQVFCSQPEFVVARLCQNVPETI